MPWFYSLVEPGFHRGLLYDIIVVSVLCTFLHVDDDIYLLNLKKGSVDGLVM